MKTACDDQEGKFKTLKDVSDKLSHEHKDLINTLMSENKTLKAK
jgi:hypothetical protein